MMKLKIMGSSGALSFPKMGCECADCKRAISEGPPHARICSSLFAYPNILFDTPEEIGTQMMRFGLTKLNHVFYTHWHPDHTQGYRIFEQWARSGAMGKPQNPPINVYLPEDMVADFEKYLKNFMDFFQKQGFINVVKVKDREPLQIEGLTITPVSFKRPDRVRYGFLIEEGGKQVLYAPCSTYQAVHDDYWRNLDVLIVEAGWPGPVSLRIEGGEHWFGDHIAFNESLKLLDELHPKRLLLTHLSSSLHHTYDKAKEKIKDIPNAGIAYDGMEIIL